MTCFQVEQKNIHIQQRRECKPLRIQKNNTGQKKNIINLNIIKKKYNVTQSSQQAFSLIPNIQY